MMLTIEKHGLIINERNDLVKRMRNTETKKAVRFLTAFLLTPDNTCYRLPYMASPRGFEPLLPP